MSLLRRPAIAKASYTVNSTGGFCTGEGNNVHFSVDGRTSVIGWNEYGHFDVMGLQI